MFRSITSKNTILAELIANEDIQSLVEGFQMEGTKEIKLIYLDAIFNLCQLEDVVAELCRHGLVVVLCEYYTASNSNDLI